MAKFEYGQVVYVNGQLYQGLAHVNDFFETITTDTGDTDGGFDDAGPPPQVVVNTPDGRTIIYHGDDIASGKVRHATPLEAAAYVSPLGSTFVPFDQIDGKTIAFTNASRRDSRDPVILWFADHTYAVIERRPSEWYGDEHCIYTDGDLSPSEKLTWGLIDQAAYERLSNEEQEARRREQEARDRKEYEQLKVKFDPGYDPDAA